MMKLTLRVTLLSVLLLLLSFTVAGLGFSSYWNARSAADDLSRQVLEQTALRIDCQVNELLLAANRLGDLNRRLLESGLFPGNDFSKIAPYWLEQMRANPRLVRLSFGLEADGEWHYVRRVRDQELAIGELRRNQQTGKLELREYWPAQYPRECFFCDRDKDSEDPRAQPWYMAARNSGGQSWSETYVLAAVHGVDGAPGVSCATAVKGRDGSLLGVVTASFSLDELCGFLQKLPVGRNGYAFVVEFHTDGSRRVIAHPDTQSLLRTVQKDGKASGQELVPPEQLADERVQTFLNGLPADLDPSKLEETRRLRFEQNGIPYLGVYACLSTRETPDWLICTIMPEEDVFEQVRRNNRLTVLIGLCVLAVAVFVSLAVSVQVAGPLEELAQQTTAIGRLQLDARPEIRSVVLEVDRLAVAMEEMRAGLRSFQKYVPSELVHSLLAAGQEARQGGELRTVTIYFCDIANFTSISEKLAPEQLVEQLSECLGALSGPILETGGTVDKYLGDGIMAFWGAPAWNPGHALAACTAALRNRDRLAKLRRQWKSKNKPLFFTRTGLHTGAVVVGNIGSEARLNYTVIGDSVNLASRLEGLNKLYGTEILISENTYRQVKSAVVARPLDWVSVKGKTKAVLVYELLGLHNEVIPTTRQFVHLYTLALKHYRKQDWLRAIDLFKKALKLRPTDGGARQMVVRCRRYLEEPPAHGWNGVHRVADK
jgi:adenylate cyclase